MIARLNGFGLWKLLTCLNTFPNFYPVNAMNMNYSTVVLGAWVLIGTIFYLASTRRKYRGPVTELRVVVATDERHG